ncbi:hypothetical protein GM418_16430 [Maribellus comscasis]|uniref:DNA-binding protein n=1 Tax=Maribellus comscasis TaxID=2681766 RepID=A0A6I6JYF3_9BACT|nr:hypothetical protein [Maribellus comscasis]QGY45202.1 hypothetical protein GM418_16430 [Maribellus comscasis]
MNMLRVFGIVMLVIVFSSCVRNKSGVPVQNEVPANANVFEVKEVVHGSTYTYMNVKEGMAEKWVAVTKQDVDAGDVYYYDNELEMKNFHSKEIDRTFDIIYFVSHISKTPMAQAPQNPMGGMMPGMGGGDMAAHSGRVATEEHNEISLEKSGNEVTVAGVFDNRDSYSGKEIEIRGVVVKVNKSVMGKNWIHIQDGTSGSDGSYDLTITSQDVAEVNDEVTFKGKITLEKDFGAGYFYEVIMEDATLVATSSTVNL